MQPDGLIIEAAGVAVRGVADLHRLMTEERIDRPVKLTVVRTGADRA